MNTVLACIICLLLGGAGGFFGGVKWREKTEPKTVHYHTHVNQSQVQAQVMSDFEIDVRDNSTRTNVVIRVQAQTNRIEVEIRDGITNRHTALTNFSPWGYPQFPGLSNNGKSRSPEGIK